MIFQKKYGMLVAMVFALVSCTVFSPVQEEPSKTYELNTLPSAMIKPSSQSQILLVTQPQANPVNNTSKMVYTKTPYQIAYFANSHWAERPANMLQGLIIQSLQNTHYFHAVISPVTAGQSDLMLNTQLLQLEQDFSKSPSQVHVVVAAQLINVSSNKIMAARQFSVTEVAPQDSPYGGVVAANRAVSEILKQLVVFCTER